MRIKQCGTILIYLQWFLCGFGLFAVTVQGNCTWSFSAKGAGQAGTITIIYKSTPPLVVANNDVFIISFPDANGGFAFNIGGISQVIGLVTTYPGQTIQQLPLQGTGNPTLSINGTTAAVILGGAGYPIAAESQIAGFAFNLTYVRNPFDNNGSNISSAATIILQNASGTLREAFNVSLPLFRYNYIDAGQGSVQPANNNAGAITDLKFTISTTGYIPSTGCMKLTLPVGFSFPGTTGDVVVTEQSDFGGNMTVAVRNVDPWTNTITLALYPILGKSPSWLAPLSGVSFLLTSIQTPWAGLTGNFTFATLSQAYDLIDQGVISGIVIHTGQLQHLAITPADNSARKLTNYTFTFGTSGIIPGNGAIFIKFPSGYYLLNVALVAANGFSVVNGISVLNITGQVVVLQLGGSLNQQLEQADYLSLVLSGVVNPGSGSTAAFFLKTSFSDVTKEIDRASTLGFAIVTGRLPLAVVMCSSLISGTQTNVSVTIVTPEFVPEDSQIIVSFPAGIAISLPAPTQVVANKCCTIAGCNVMCNVSVLSTTSTTVRIGFLGSSQQIFPAGTNLSISLGNIRHLYAGQKDGFDLSLILSDGSSIAQAKDLDGPLIVAGHLINATAIFQETYQQSSSSVPYAGRCGGYSIRAQINGIFPAFGRIVVTFPSGILLNDYACDFDSDNFLQPVSRLSGTRIPSFLVDQTVDARAGTVTIAVNGGSSDTWSNGQQLQFYITNLRHTAQLPLQNVKIQTFTADLTSVIEEDVAVPLIPSVASPSYSVSVRPVSLNAGVRTEQDVTITVFRRMSCCQISSGAQACNVLYQSCKNCVGAADRLACKESGRLPINSLIEVVFPAAFLINDGDSTEVIVSTIDGQQANIQVVFASNNVVRVKIAPDYVSDGIINSSWSCPAVGNGVAGSNSTACVRTPNDVIDGTTLVGSTIYYKLSQITNLAGGLTDPYQVRTLTAGSMSIVEQNTQVTGASLVVGQLSDGTIIPASQGSAARTTMSVMIQVSNTLPSNGAVYVQFPAGFILNDGGNTSVSNAYIVSFNQKNATNAVILAIDPINRSVIIGIGGSPQIILGTFDQVLFVLDKIRNMVSRPPPGNTSQTSGTFRLTSRLSNNADIETIVVPGIEITANQILAYPFGNGIVTTSSLSVNVPVSCKIQYSADSVLPSDGIISIQMPSTYLLNANGNTTGNMTVDKIPDPAISVIVQGNTVQIIRKNSMLGPIYSGQLIQINLLNIRSPLAVGSTSAYRVSALNSDGASIAVGDLTGTVFGRPSVPQNISAKYCKSQWFPGWNDLVDDLRCFIIYFNAPAQDGGSPITQYLIETDQTSFAFTQITQIISITANQTAGNKPGSYAVQTMMQSQGIYLQIRISAFNNNTGIQDRGSYGYAGPVRAMSVPGKPTAAQIKAYATNKIFLSWFAPEFTGAVLPNVPILSYRIEFDINGSSFQSINATDTIIAPGASLSTVSRLLRPGVYRVRISASNEAGFGEPDVYSLAGIASPLVMPAWDESVTPANNAVLKIKVGYLANFTLRAFDGDVTDAVNIEVQEDPGIPPSSSVGPSSISGINGGAQNVGTRILEITPELSQVGQKYEVCFVALNTNPQPLGGDTSVTRCFVLDIVGPELSWISSSHAASDDALTPLEGTEYAAYPGCTVSIPLAANSVWYGIGFGYDAYEILLNGSLLLLDKLPGVTIVYNPGLDAQGVGPADNYTHHATFRYEATRALSGRSQRVCMWAKDEFQVRTVYRCVLLRTGNCRACLRQGQTLRSLAAEYNTDWLQIWATNPRMGNPNLLSQSASSGPNAGGVLNLGVLYHAAGGETVADLAARFYSTTYDILSTNPTFVLSAGGAVAASTFPVAAGQEICIVPPVCGVYCPGGGLCRRRPDVFNPGFVS